MTSIPEKIEQIFIYIEGTCNAEYTVYKNKVPVGIGIIDANSFKDNIFNTILDFSIPFTIEVEWSNPIVVRKSRVIVGIKSTKSVVDARGDVGVIIVTTGKNNVIMSVSKNLVDDPNCEAYIDFEKVTPEGLRPKPNFKKKEKNIFLIMIMEISKQV